MVLFSIVWFFGVFEYLADGEFVLTLLNLTDFNVRNDEVFSFFC